MKKLIAIAICTCMCVCFFAGCSKDGDDPIENPNQPEPEKPAEVTLKLSTEDLAFEAKGGWKEFTINSSAAWTISGGNAWCQPGVTTGTGTTQVKVMVEAYTGTTDRNAVLTVRAGSLSVTLTVTQKAVHALTLTKDKFDVPQEGGNIDIEVKSNINYTVSIPTAFQEWIKEAPKSKAMETKSFRFTVAANEEAEKREGYIVISGNELKDTVYVYQAERKCLILDKNSCTLSAQEQELTVELRTNVDYEVVVPDSVSGWVSCPPESRALRTDKLRLLIGENGLEKKRQAVVIVKDRNSELADTLHIRQSGKGEPEEPANLFPKTHPRLGYKANSATTVTFTILLPWEATVTYGDEATGWLSVSPTSGEAGEATLQLTSTMTNEASTERNAYIDITYGDKTQRLTVAQRAYGETEITDRFDPNFARVLQKQGYIPDANSITEKEVKRITELPYLYDEGLTSLRGIEYLTALTRLNCPNNQLTTLDVSKNTALTQLWCYNNKITTLDVSGCTALTLLWCQENQITTLDVSKNTALTRLYCNGNQLSALDVSKNTELIDLYCGSNKITTLDVSKNTELTSLDCFRNQLTMLDVSKNTALLNLDCFRNQLSTLDISKNTTLATLYCGRNQLTTLDISKNTALACLSCHGNQLSTLDASKNLRLTSLECQENPGNGTTFLLKAWFDRNDMPEDMLTGWYYNDKHITIEFQKNDTEIFAKTDYSLDYKANSINVDFFVPNAWKASIVYEGNNSEWLSLSKMSGEAGRAILELTPTRNTKGTERKAYLDITYGDKRQRLTITQQAIKGNITDRFDPKFAQVLQEEGYIPDANTITEEEAKEITILNLSNKELTTLRGIEYFTALTLLRCENNRLTTLDVSKNTELVELSCENNQLTTLDASGCSALTRLECHNNQLTTLNVSKNTALTDLKCNNNQLNTLDVSKNTALTNLGCNNNQLTTLNVSKNTALTSLNCYENQLSTLDVSRNTALTDLKCNNNQLTTLDISGCTKLTELECYKNQLILLDISKNRALNRLQCGENPGNGTALPVLTWFNKMNIPTPLYSLSGLEFILYNTEETEYLLPFYANSDTFGFAFPCAWEASVSYEGDASGWLSISPTSGEAGPVIINLDATRNSQNPERKAYIDITYGNETRRITVTQKEQGDNIADRFDPEFARILKERGIIADVTYIKVEDVNKITSLSIGTSGVDRLELNSLKGIEYFTALTKLTCIGTQLTSLDVSKNTKLTELDCRNNQLAILNVSGCAALTKLYCHNNQLTALDVSKNTALTSLLCITNQLTNLDISKCTALTDLQYYNNPGNGSTFPLKTWFDMNSMPQYSHHTWTYDDKYIVLEINGIKVEDFPKTEYFLPFYTNSTTVEFTVPCTWKASVSDEENGSQWLSISPTSGKAGQVTINLTALRNRNTERQGYIDITYTYRYGYRDIQKTQRITVTQAARNAEDNLADRFDPEFARALENKGYIAEADFITAEEVNQITKLDVSSSKLTTLQGIEYFTALTELQCRGNYLFELNLDKNTELSILECSYNQLTSLDVSRYTKLTRLECNDNEKLTTLNVSGCAMLNTLKCDGDPLMTIDVSKNTALDTLSCGYVKLTTLDVSKNAALAYLDCRNNQLTILDVSKNTKLTGLSCYGNQLTELDVSKNTALTHLDCSENQITTLDVSKNTTLTRLRCNGETQKLSNGSWEYIGQLTTLNVSGCSALTELSCRGNKLTELNVSGCSALTKLYCYKNQLTTLDVSGCTKLTTLDCYTNRLATLNVSGCTALTSLTCFDNQLTTLDVSGCTKLTGLYCYKNQLTTLDVSECTNLTFLKCNDNRLSTLNVSKTKLSQLSCHNNPGDGMASFPLTTWVKGNKPGSLTIENTSWTYNGKTITITYQ